MKKIIVILMLVLLASCANEPKEKKHTRDESETNVITVIKVNMDDTRYYYEIVEVEGHRYLSCSAGGLIHMESCPCKSK